jgi:putative addiction module CopG family antidote
MPPFRFAQWHPNVRITCDDDDLADSELERFIAAKVASGRYQDPTEVVEEGLRLLEAREQDHQAALAEIRQTARAAAGPRCASASRSQGRRKHLTKLIGPNT